MNRRMAVIADIHGNYDALSEVMKDMEKFDIDAVYCLGDIVSLGHQTNEVLELLTGLPNLTIIRGNHDEEVLKAFRKIPSEVTGPEHDHHVWVAEHLDPVYEEYLAALPLVQTREAGGKKILLTHYHLESDDTYTPIDPAPSVESLAPIYRDSDHDIILFGHDHMRHHFEHDHQLFLNPGALGVTSTAYAPYMIIEIEDDGAVHITHRNVHYDRQAFIGGLRREDPPAMDYILNVLLKERG
ncbi:metallophosphoesterase family protein [Salinicoccus roseus]|uniref:Phosphoesterase n=2 Tax=Salinicoccus roseus TaxID=45670 RepID=A0ABT4YKF9_9STAP|nr:metallophosphoesterase family protein [Salinicoccus roseus]MDB0581326.1 metallophosphoesterase family protein [Salinicoccus roseus]